VDAQVGADFLSISGGVLSSNLGPFFDLVAESLLEPTFPADEVSIARDRLRQRLIEYRAYPGFIAAERLLRRMILAHPYAVLAPTTEGVGKTGREVVRRFWRDAMVPAGAFLVLVGDVRPAAAVEAARASLADWRRRPPRNAAPPLPKPRALPTLLVHRAGAVQTNIRLGGFAPRRSEPDYAAAVVANTIFGGYFSSRLVENIRERKGYTYGSHSMFDERRRTNFLLLDADVRNEVTAAALTEIRYELGRMCSLPVEPAELEGAKRYLLGIQALALQSQQGLAGQLAALEAYGVGPDFLSRYRRDVARVTADDVLAAARRYLAPSALTCVLVGDAGAITRDVEALEPVELSPRKR
jgi:predicted Zn-dependent peptidase